jgi:hypothetical protein
MKVKSTPSPSFQEPTFDFGTQEKLIQSALNIVGKSGGKITAKEAQGLVDLFAGSELDYMFRYGLRNVTSDHYEAYTTIGLPPGTVLTPEAKAILDAAEIKFDVEG